MILNGKYYSGFKRIDGRGNDSALTRCIEETLQYCLDSMSTASEKSIDKPIMMLGKVQSGKTRAFTGLIALAFDNDFDMVFILTKNSKALATQTVSRMKKEFAFERHSVIVTDIMKTSAKMSGYELERKNIIVAKKQKDNIPKLIEFIERHSINQNKRCLIIDDEADTTGIGYEKKKDSDEYSLRTISRKVNEMRGILEGCVFVEVTATPYALYLQPDFDEKAPIKPVRPLKTVAVPFGSDYIGGEYYFIKSRDDSHPASLLFEPMSQDECDMVSDQKRNGKKSKIEDRRSFKEEEILIRKDRLSTFKRGIVNFIIGSITLRKIHSEEHYAYVIHTATQQNSHFRLESIAEYFMAQIRGRTAETKVIIEELLRDCYTDIKQSVEMYSLEMPSLDYVVGEFYKYVDNEYYSIDVVNGEKEIEPLLDEESGELLLRTPCSIFVGGQILDRGITVRNMIGFYYGRNPKTMQQDTVLQHSRMFGYRKDLLPVTRFYTTMRIHSNMEKITEIDEMLYSDIQKGKQGDGVYFITKMAQDKSFGCGEIKPCSPAKILISDIILLKPHHRLLPVGFSPVAKSSYVSINKKIEKLLSTGDRTDNVVYGLPVDKAKELLTYVYDTFTKDEDGSRFVDKNEFIVSLEYCIRDCAEVLVHVYRNMNISKYRHDDSRLQDSPDTARTHLAKAKSDAVDRPVIMLFQENGLDASWGNRAFWWPVLVAPKNTPNSIYALKAAREKATD